MRILISSLTYPLRNGVTSSINLSVDGLLARGHEVRIIAPEYDRGKFRPEHITLTSSIVGKLFLQLFGKEERMFALDARPELEKVIADFRPDVFWLHTVNWMPSLFEKMMLESDAGKVLTYHTLVEQYGRAYAGEIGAKQMIRRSKKLGNEVDQIITPSQVIASKLRSYGVKKPISVVPTGIEAPHKTFTKKELATRFNFPPSSHLLLWVGRISKEKSIGDLLTMASNLKKIRSDFTLLLIGPGDVEEYRDRASKLGLDGNVIFTGALSGEESKASYGAADAFVFASQTETQGLVLGEAMIAGTPVVALTSPIQPEIYPEDMAVVVRRKNDFAEAVDELLNDPKRHEKLARKGKEFVLKNFSREMMTDKQEKVLQSAMVITPAKVDLV